MVVDVVTAAWLRAQAEYATHASGPIETAWGALAPVSEIISPFAVQAAAYDEAVRQHDFLGHPTAIEKIEVPGKREDLVGRRIVAIAAGGGYSAGITVFVIGAEPAGDVDRTTLTVLRRLA